MVLPVKILNGILREQKKKKSRSGGWSHIRNLFLKTHSECAACDSTTLLQVHHVKPFHLFPELELDPENLITLCGWRNLCHWQLGHGALYPCWVPEIRARAAQIKSARANKLLEEVKGIIELCRQERRLD